MEEIKPTQETIDGLDLAIKRVNECRIDALDELQKVESLLAIARSRYQQILDCRDSLESLRASLINKINTLP